MKVAPSFGNVSTYLHSICSTQFSVTLDILLQINIFLFRFMYNCTCKRVLVSSSTHLVTFLMVFLLLPYNAHNRILEF